MGARSGERIQKVLARAGLGSRRSVEDLVRDGLVTVNGQVAQIGEKVDVLRDAIKVDGKRLRLPKQHRYLLLNKPSGVVTTTQDPEGRRTVLDLVPARERSALFPVGRLDYHTEGLLLLTTDGDFADRVMHPRHGCSKVYRVKVRGVPADEKVDRLRRGIRLAGRRTEPAWIERKLLGGGRKATHNSWWQVTLNEGRTRQIREMFQRIGHPVQRLQRVGIGGLRDRTLKPGEVRALTPEEVELVLSAKSARKAAPRRPPKAGKPPPRGAKGRARKPGRSAGGKKRSSRKTGRKGPGPRRRSR